MKLTINLNIKDILEYSKFSIKNQFDITRSVIYFLIMLALVSKSIIAFLDYNYMYLSSVIILFVSMIISYIICFIIFPNFIVFYLYLQIRKNNFLDNDNITLYFEDEYFSFGKGENCGKIYYEMLENIKYGKNAIYLCTGKNSAYLIPNRTFKSNYERQKFIDYIDKKVLKS